ncbi:hypothetical protein F2Q69_00007635 [Brassica cretica]|uniref:Uncharacterized protein n=1 Tax=Brassica cretica TaxID=69181 RepID=A0A8S9NNA3_BRACR|nr:hypothetical protein F2Q69_00007635 [Brassica cretica]
MRTRRWVETKAFIRSENRSIELQKGKESVESKPAKASLPEVALTLLDLVRLVLLGLAVESPSSVLSPSRVDNSDSIGPGLPTDGLCGRIVKSLQVRFPPLTMKHEISDEDERAVYGGNWYRDVYKETCLFLKHVVGTFFMKSLTMGCSLALSLVGAVTHEFMVLHLALKFELLHLLAAIFCSECALLLHGSFLYKPDNRTDYTHTAAEPSLQNRVASSASFRSVKKPAISSNGDLVVEHVNMILYELFHSLRPPDFILGQGVDFSLLGVGKIRQDGESNMHDSSSESESESEDDDCNSPIPRRPTGVIEGALWTRVYSFS